MNIEYSSLHHVAGPSPGPFRRTGGKVDPLLILDVLACVLIGSWFLKQMYTRIYSAVIKIIYYFPEINVGQWQSELIGKKIIPLGGTVSNPSTEVYWKRRS